MDKTEAEIEKRLSAYRRDFACIAVGILGTGYTPDYYRTITNELEAAFREGYKAGAESAIDKPSKKRDTKPRR